MLTIDNRCSVCEREGKGIYRMVGSCSNCGTRDILILCSTGHVAPRSLQRGRCPVCGCDEVRADRLATEDEIPAAAEPFPA